MDVWRSFNSFKMKPMPEGPLDPMRMKHIAWLEVEGEA